MVSKLKEKTKVCSKCSERKLLKKFCRDKSTKSGKASWCKDCVNVYHKIYLSRAEVKEKKSQYNKKWRIDNKEQWEEYKCKYYQENKTRLLQQCKIYRDNNKNKIAQYYKDRIKRDPQYRIIKSLRSRLYQVLKNNQKVGSAVRDLGCSIKDLKFYLKSKFYSRSKTNEQMTWANYGANGWQIDHIKPLIAFNLADKKQFLKACNYSNLQPLWEEDNRKKGGRINYRQ